MSAFSVGSRRERERENVQDDEQPPGSGSQPRSRSSSHSHSFRFSSSSSLRSQSVDSFASSSFLSRFRRSSVSTTGSDGINTPTEPAVSFLSLPQQQPLQQPAKKPLTRRRARTLETIPQNSATNASGRISRSLRPNRSSHSATRLNSGQLPSFSVPSTRVTSARHSVFSFHRRNVQDLSRSRVTFEEPGGHPLHDHSSSSLRSCPVSPVLTTSPGLPPSLRLVPPDIPTQSYRPRSLMSSLSESDMHTESDRSELPHAASAPISPSALVPPNADLEIRSPRALSPTPSSTSSQSSNQKSFAKLRRKVASALFNHSSFTIPSPTKAISRSRASSSRSSSDLNIATPDLRHQSDSSTPLASPGSPRTFPFFYKLFT